MDLRPYVVRPGDYLAKLAHVYGFDADEVWNDPKNDEIRAIRKDHGILAPGDVIFLPVKPRDGLPIEKGTTNRYTVTIPKVDVRLVIKDDAGDPVAGERYIVEGLGSAPEGTTGPDGAVSFAVPVHVREVSLLFPQRNARMVVRVGDLDPLEESSGVAGRLRNLGFLHTSAGASSDAHMAAALRAFQRAHGLPETGSLDEDTRRALKDIHGS